MSCLQLRVEGCQQKSWFMAPGCSWLPQWSSSPTWGSHTEDSVRGTDLALIHTQGRFEKLFEVITVWLWIEQWSSDEIAVGEGGEWHFNREAGKGKQPGVEMAHSEWCHCWKCSLVTLQSWRTEEYNLPKPQAFWHIPEAWGSLSSQEKWARHT